MALNLPVAIDALRTLEIHRFATIWTVERFDGVVLRFTDHDEPIVHGGQTYVPAGGFSPSAREKHVGTEKASNLEIRGIVSSNAITEEDLRAGRYREANVTERKIDWRYPWLGTFDRRVYAITETKFSVNGWEATLEGNTRKLRQAAGRVIQRRCSYDLGQPIRSDGPGLTGGCGIDLATVTTTAQTVTSIANSRRKFSASALPSQSAQYYRHGVVTWLTGANAGLSFEVQGYGNSARQFSLYLRTPFDIEIGDTFTARAGCDGERSTCKDKFGNIVNFGGFPWVPGSDKALSTPTVPEE